MFHSPEIAADGTSRAALRRLRIQLSPKRRNDSSLLRCQPTGRVFMSSLPISSESGNSPSIDTKSAGLRFGSRFTKVSTAASANDVEHRRRARLGCSSGRRRNGLLHRWPCPQRTVCGRLSRIALTVYAISYPAENVFDHAYACVRIELVEGPLST